MFSAKGCCKLGIIRSGTHLRTGEEIDIFQSHFFISIDFFPLWTLLYRLLLLVYKLLWHGGLLKRSWQLVALFAQSIHYTFYYDPLGRLLPFNSTVDSRVMTVCAKDLLGTVGKSSSPSSSSLFPTWLSSGSDLARLNRILPTINRFINWAYCLVPNCQDQKVGLAIIGSLWTPYNLEICICFTIALTCQYNDRSIWYIGR